MQGVDKMKKRFCAMLMVIGLLVGSVSAAMASYTAGSYMQYEIEYISIDVQGKYNDEFIQTTFGNYGYEYAMESLKDASVGLAAQFIANGRYVQLLYTITAGQKAITEGKFAVHADVQIDDDDDAAIETITADGKVIGISMKDSEGAQFSLYFRDAVGITEDADTYWFGCWYDRESHAFEQLSVDNTSSIGTYSSDYNSYAGYDSGFAASWHNIQLAPGQSQTFSIIVGAGEAAESIQLDDQNPLSLSMDSITKGTEHVTATGMANATKDSLMLYYSADGEEFHPVESSSVDTASQPGKTIITGNVPTKDLAVGVHTLSFYIADTESIAMSAIKDITIHVVENVAAVTPPAVPLIPDLPQTGDSSQLLLWAALMLFSSTAAVLLKRRLNRVK